MMERLSTLMGRVPCAGFIWILILFFEASCHASTKTPSQKSLPAVNVRVTEVSSGETEHFSRVSAVVEGERDARINSRVQARVESVYVHTGQLVHKGELLFQLSGSVASDKLRSARARLENVHFRFLRMDALYQKKEASRQEWDAARAEDLMASADYSAAKNEVSLARIVAPFSGKVALRNVRVGDVVHPGFLLAEVLRDGNLRVVSSIPEHLAGDLAPGMRLVFRVKKSGVKKDLPATVRAISPRSDPGTHTIFLKADLGAVPDLRPGSYGEILLPSGKEASVLVPESAVINHDGIREVFVVKNGLARLRFIRIGHLKNRSLSGASSVEVLSGLNLGEEVVTSHEGDLSNQTPVHVLGGN